MSALQRFIIVGLIAGCTYGAKAEDFKPGDKVEVQFGPKWYSGEIVEKRSDSVFTVKVDRNGRERNVPVFKNKIRKANGAGTGNPFGEGKQAPNRVAAYGPTTWSLKPSPPIQPVKPLVEKPILLSPHVGHPFFEGIKVLGFDREGGKAFILRSSRDGGTVTKRIERVDLAAGKTMGTVSFEEKTVFFDVDPTGKLLAARPDPGPGKNDNLDIWDISGAEPKKVTSWRPFAVSEASRKDVGDAHFVDADHLLTVAAGGELMLWNIPNKKAIYFIKTKANNKSAVSANGKYMAVTTKEGMFVFDAMTGKSLGKLAGGEGVFMKFAFSPDGQLLALHAQGGRLQVWDCEKGERVRDLYLTGIEKASKLDWVSNQHVMVRYVGPSFLVDVDRRVIFWKYDGIKDGEMLGDRFWCVVGLGAGKALYPGQFPHEAALKSAALPPADELLLLKPGSQVKLDVKTPAAPNHKSQVEQTLSARLDENGISVSPNSKIVLEAVSEKGKTRSITFRRLGRIRGGNDTVQVTEQIYKMTLKYDGNVMWQTQLVKAAPTLLRRKEGQSIEDALAEYTKPDVSFFINKPLPRLVAKPGPHDGAYGTAKISAQGIQ